MFPIKFYLKYLLV